MERLAGTDVAAISMTSQTQPSYRSGIFFPLSFLLAPAKRCSQPHQKCRQSERERESVCMCVCVFVWCGVDVYRWDRQRKRKRVSGGGCEEVREGVSEWTREW